MLNTNSLNIYIYLYIYMDKMAYMLGRTMYSTECNRNTESEDKKETKKGDRIHALT